MKKLCEHVQVLAYELRMIYISCESLACMCGGIQSVLANTNVLESVLKKNSSSLAYYLIREGAVMDDWRIACVNTHDN